MDWENTEQGKGTPQDDSDEKSQNVSCRASRGGNQFRQKAVRRLWGTFLQGDEARELLPVPKPLKGM